MDQALHVAVFVVFLRAGGRGERREIMLAFEETRCFGHRGFIERPGIVERAAVVEGRENWAAIDAVTIRLTLRHPARMEVLAHFFGGHNAHGRRQKRVHARAEFRRRREWSAF